MELIIRKIDNRNYENVLNLGVSKEQQGFIESVEECLEEAKAYPNWRPVAII